MDLHICRICGGTEELKEIFEQDVEMVEKLSECANIRIDSNDALPKFICEHCANNLEISYRLRKQSNETQRLLRRKMEMRKSEDSSKEQKSIKVSQHRRIECDNVETTRSQNLETEYDNRHNFIGETLLDDEIYVDVNQPECSTDASMIEQCTIDVLSSSTSEKSDFYKNNENGYGTNVECLFTCDTCQNEFHSKKDYIAHIKEHGSQRFQCIQCCKLFPTRYRLRRHEEVHSETLIHQCVHCERGYRVLHNLHRHIRSVHLNGKNFDCSICNVSYSRKDVLKRHMLLHSDTKNFHCLLCSQSFKTKDYLNAHLKSRHEKDVQKGKVSKRIRSNDSKKYQCGYCGKIFKSSFPYKNHILIHTNEKPHECETCKKKFRTIAALITHQRIHDDYRPYQCDVCLKSFKQISHLKEHKFLHLGNAPQYTCSVCQSSFVKKSNLKAHLQVHATEKPFKCAECTAEFTYMHLLQQHANRVHNRKISKEYVESEIIDLVERDNNVEICNESLEPKILYFINTSESGTEEVFGGNEKSVVECEMQSEKEFEKFYISNDNKFAFNEDNFIDYIHLESSNSVQSLLTDEVHYPGNICGEEIYTTEENAEIFVNEETVFTDIAFKPNDNI
ncbi:hypothetical protein DOY81_010310 [Sarcophaga bullata]|nr:hypothetical protein DOY81_010310 [Sarcophaga bullata]